MGSDAHPVPEGRCERTVQAARGARDKCFRMIQGDGGLPRTMSAQAEVSRPDRRAQETGAVRKPQLLDRAGESSKRRGGQFCPCPGARGLFQSSEQPSEQLRFQPRTQQSSQLPCKLCKRTTGYARVFAPQQGQRPRAPQRGTVRGQPRCQPSGLVQPAREPAPAIIPPRRGRPRRRPSATCAAAPRRASLSGSAR